MGSDSITFEQNLFLQYSIVFIMGEECACFLWKGNGDCIRCDLLKRAEQTYPIQYAQAQASYERAK